VPHNIVSLVALYPPWPCIPASGQQQQMSKTGGALPPLHSLRKFLDSRGWSACPVTYVHTYFWECAQFDLRNRGKGRDQRRTTFLFCIFQQHFLRRTLEVDSKASLSEQSAIASGGGRDTFVVRNPRSRSYGILRKDAPRRLLTVVAVHMTVRRCAGVNRTCQKFWRDESEPEGDSGISMNK
jgi:hypothetical protein